MAGDHRVRRLLAAGVAAFLSLVPASARAQGEGVVTGHVQNAQGQALPGVAIKLLKAGQVSQPKTSGADGDFRFEKLASGVYSVAASLEGYAPVNCPGVRIVVSVERHFAIKLVPASEGGPPSTCEIVTEPAQPQ
ncbi:MAG TPA: carboxypeptidase-like regulatory domain-containing protein [Thermoanaerobaculia bacterium]|jgi:hypothetical protein|nr:carboxypeptidase-like regulatory domain-containing protein [Thermoanaerobaculia bacterium]